MNEKGLIYSVDKVKMEFKCLRKEVLQKILNEFSYSSFSDEYYQSNKICKCKHNFRIDCGNGVVYVGVEPNWNFNSQYNKSIVLEYNPKDRKSTRLNSSHANISYAVFCLKKKKKLNL